MVTVTVMCNKYTPSHKWPTSILEWWQGLLFYLHVQAPKQYIYTYWLWYWIVYSCCFSCHRVSLLFLCYVGAASCTHDLSTAENVNDLLDGTNARRNGSYVFRIDGNMTRQPSEGNRQFRFYIYGKLLSWWSENLKCECVLHSFRWSGRKYLFYDIQCQRRFIFLWLWTWFQCSTKQHYVW